MAARIFWIEVEKLFLLAKELDFPNESEVVRWWPD
jgi:hypothetical protein